MITSLIKLFVALNSNGRSVQIAFGIAWGLFLALIPASNLLWVILFISMFFLRINQGAAILFTVITKSFIPPVDPLLDQIGLYILTLDILTPLFTTLYNTPVIPFSNFNHTLVTGGFLTGIVLFAPVTILANLLIKLYRKTIREKIRNSKIVKSLKAIPIISKIMGKFSQVSRYYRVLR